jgi:hypothetical protein
MSRSLGPYQPLQCNLPDLGTYRIGIYKNLDKQMQFIKLYVSLVYYIDFSTHF